MNLTFLGGEIILLGVFWTVIICISILFSCANGSVAELSAAFADSTAEAVRLIIDTGGMICLWCGVMELMRECGLAEALSRQLKPVLKLLFPKSSRNPDVLQSLSANVSANLLGLGNAATPMGVRTAQGMAGLSSDGTASDELCRLVVINTASIQLIPTTAAAIRAANGAEAAFDILPAVWISSAFSVAVGITASYIFARVSKRKCRRS